MNSLHGNGLKTDNEKMNGIIINVVFEKDIFTLQ